MPFHYTGDNDFFKQLDYWISDLFYEQLPELGYEVREEQIYTTFHIIKGMKERQVLFAEAGSGTGKTFAYLLPYLCYARLKGSPVILAVSSPVLQDQLMNPDGDIASLSRKLSLDIDARIAKRPEHYACELKLERLNWSGRVTEKQMLAEWSGRSSKAERSEIPEISDATWAEVAWDDSLSCDHCRHRQGCRLVKSRKRFREARDFIICEHEVFFRDLWLREEQQFLGRLTYLPNYSAVVFDEAHLIDLPLAKSLGRKLNQSDLTRVLDSITDINDQRLIVSQRADQTREAAKAFFRRMRAAALTDELADRMHIRLDEALLDSTHALEQSVEVLQDELVIEESMQAGTPWEWALTSYQERLDAYRQGLNLLLQGEERAVTWWESKDASAWVLPREFSHSLKNELFARRLPVLFTSATLAAGLDFSYMEQLTGAQQALHSQVGVPFDLADQVVAYLADDLPDGDNQIQRAVPHIEQLLAITKGRSLILCHSPLDVEHLRSALETKQLPYRLLWEGDADRAKLVEDFRSDTSSVLVGSGLWEGVDVPGEALSQVIILTLPFPQHDPLVEARRREAEESGLDPYAVIDLPSMLLKLRQGFGRLIRTSSDRGLISILDSRPGTSTHEQILESLPKCVPIVSNLSETAQLAKRVLG